MLSRYTVAKRRSRKRSPTIETPECLRRPASSFFFIMAIFPVFIVYINFFFQECNLIQEDSRHTLFGSVMTALIPTKRKGLHPHWDQQFDPFEWSFFQLRDTPTMPPLDSIPYIKDFKVKFRDNMPSVYDVRVFADIYKYNVSTRKMDSLIGLKVEATLIDDIFVFRIEDGELWRLAGLSWVDVLERRGIFVRGVLPKHTNDWQNPNLWERYGSDQHELRNITVLNLPESNEKSKICNPVDDLLNPHNMLRNITDLTTPCSTGKERCVISFALWCSENSGSQHECQEYLNSMKSLHYYAKIFKGWEIRVYTDDSMLDMLNKHYSQFNIIRVDDEFLGDGTWGMIWRILPLFDPTVDRFISRDVDARATLRGWGAVYEWIRSGYPSLRVTDHVYHSSWPSYDKWWGIMGGMYGMRSDALTGDQKLALLEELRTTPHVHAHGGDQDWLRDHLWPLIGHGIMSFTSHFCEEERQRKTDFGEWSMKSLQRIRRTFPWPIPHTQCDFVIGTAYPDILPIVPPGCRHPNHPDWVFG